MGRLDDRLFQQHNKRQVHPTARLWLSKCADVNRAVVEIDRRRDGLVFRPARIYFYASADRQGFSDKDEWDEELNEDLIDAGVVAADENHEALRFSMTLRSRFTATEGTFGDDYFSAVLVDYLDTRGISGFPAVREMRNRIATLRPSRATASYDDCVASIESVLGAAGRNLAHTLRYGREAAERVLISALAMYLDERFSITNAVLLGFSK